MAKFKISSTRKSAPNQKNSELRSSISITQRELSLGFGGRLALLQTENDPGVDTLSGGCGGNIDLPGGTDAAVLNGWYNTLSSPRRLLVRPK